MEFLMKKTLAILALTAASSFAVVKPYVGASVGYTLGQPSGNLGTESTASTDENIYGTLGGGAIPLSVHAGVIDNGVVGAQIGMTYLMGQELEVDKESGVTTKSTLSGVLLTPAVVIAAKGPFTPFAKFGLVFGTNMKNEFKTSGIKTEYTGGTAFGFEGALGGEFAVQERLGLTLEVAAQSLKWAPTESETAGVSRTYEDEINSTTGNVGLKRVQDLSNLAIKIGFNYRM
jgi:hypothetical protein